MDTSLPVTLLNWLLALLPILILLALLVWRKWSTSAAAPIALALAVLVAVLIFRTSMHTLAIAAGKGIWDAIFILYVIWPALILYNVSNEAGSFDAIQRGLRRLMPDRLLVVLAFSWVLAPFIQSIAGFGTPLAVTTPLLIGLGVKPLFAVILPMIGAAWANMFGSLGANWLATQSVVNFADETLMLRYTTLLVWIPNLTAGLAIAWFYGKGWALKRAAPAILVISLIQGGLQMLLVPIVPTIGLFLANSAALLGLFALNRWGYYRKQDEDEPQNIFTEEGIRTFHEENRQEAEMHNREAQTAALKRARGGGGVSVSGLREKEGGMSLFLAFTPYIVLAVLAVAALLVPPINRVLEQVSIGLPFPATQTGFGVSQPAEETYAAFTPLTHPGTLLLIASLVGYLVYRRRGAYDAEDTPGSILSRSAEDALPTTAAITALMILSKVMDHSGEITVLALGVAQVASPLVYVGLSNFLGILGSLTTSSNTASNVLFAPLQFTTAEAQGLSPEFIVAGQAAGGAIGNALAPGDALMGATVAGIPNRLGEILAKGLPWSLITGLLVSAAMLAIYLLQ